MLAHAKWLLTFAVVFISGGLFAQEIYHSPDPDLMARLSYDSPQTMQAEDVRHVCVAVSRDGDYRIIRMQSDGQTQRLHGKMPQEQLQQLKSLLASDAFKGLSGNHGGLIRQESESFGAEVVKHNNDRTQRLHWLNADGENPFPTPVTKVVDWLKRFDPKDGKTFDYAEYPDVCPSGGLRLLDPSVAGNAHP